MDTFHYTCLYCGKTYKPNRRKKQKYCSNSCRTRAFQIRNPKLGSTLPTVEKKTAPVKIEKMSLPGVANAAAGVAAVKLIESIFTSEDNKAVTKKDFKVLKDLIINRYHPILNMPPNAFGSQPFYDVETKSVVYLKK